MKKLFRFFILLMILFSFSCEYFSNDNSRGVTALDREYIFIASILCPDSTRSHKVEVFTGVIKPNPIPNTPPIGEDSILTRVINTIRSEYRCDFEGITSSKVFISNSSGNTVELSPTFDGIFQDKYNQLKILADSTYYLKVVIEGKIYTSSTKVPKQVKILEPNTDTVHLFLRRHPALGTIIPTSYLRMTRIPAHFEYYRLTSFTFVEEMHHLEGLPFVSMGQVVSNEGYNITRPKPDSLFDKILFSNETKYAEVHDSNYASIYEPESTFGADTEWWAWYQPRRKMNLKFRSTIQDGDNVAGVFGSITTDKKSYVLVVPKMTSHYEFPPGYVPPTKP